MTDFDFQIKTLKPISGFEIGSHYANLFGVAIITLLDKMGYAPGRENTYYFDPKKGKNRFNHSEAEGYIGICYFYTPSDYGFKVDGETYEIGLIFMDKWIDGGDAENVNMITSGWHGNMNLLSLIYNYLRIEAKSAKNRKK